MRPASVVASVPTSVRRDASAALRSASICACACSTMRAASVCACSRISAMIAAPCSRASSRIRAASWRASAICDSNSSSAAWASDFASSSWANSARMASCRAVIARLIGGMTYLVSRNISSAKAASSTKNVAFGTRKLLSMGVIATLAIWVPLLPSDGRDGGPRSGEHEDEQRHEREVDEEHRLDQTDRQEEDGLQATLRLRLTGHALDVRRTGQTVTDTGTDRATRQGD